jgi:hypothetical protein
LQIGLAPRLQSDTGDEFPDGEWFDDVIARTADNSVNLGPRSVKKDWGTLAYGNEPSQSPRQRGA